MRNDAKSARCVEERRMDTEIGAIETKEAIRLGKCRGNGY